MRNVFSEYHPVSILVYYMILACITICYMHPFILFAGLLGGFANYVFVHGAKAFFQFLKVGVLVWIIVVLANVLFTHEGATILSYFPSGNPFTLESLIFGMCSGVMVLASLSWFMTLSKLMTSDKWLHIFGSILPTFGLMFSMVLRFVPLYNQKHREIIEANSINCESLSWLGKVKHHLTCFAITLVWALEHGVVTADSMTARGYGTGKRSHYRQFVFRKKDGMIVGAMLLFLILFLGGIVREHIYYAIYPLIYIEWNVETLMAGVVMLVLGLYPIWISLIEEWKWRKQYVQNS